MLRKNAPVSVLPYMNVQLSEGSAIFESGYTYFHDG
ncbi:hypothetical protein SAMN05216571_104289 [Onishia taeanensis]|uniref:Uncharacterized protein n=1 Tax=Onishia taeanensis TaxID=284577 RepID=A0A1G7RJ04_9GAMM|nr:hypothetical protein SAMN05216571_104289 [Halomonas taeanensis]